MIVNTNAALTQEMLESAREHAMGRFGAPDTIRINPAQHNQLVEYGKWLKWLSGLTEFRRRQEELKYEIKGRLGRYKNRSLPV
jgi:hypothetical protein